MKRKLLLLLFALSFSGLGWGQETIALQDFEDTPATPTWSYSATGGGTNATTNKYNGAKSYRLELSQILTMNNIDISGYTSVVLSVAFAGAGPDSGEDLFMDISYDNGLTWTGTGSIKLVDGYSNTPIDINTTNASNPTTVGSNPWPTNIGASETQISVRFRCIGLDGSEYYYIDDVKLTGTLAGSTPPTLTADVTDNNVDNDIEITFIDDATWREAVTAVKIGGTALTVTTDYVLTTGNLQLKPSGLNALLTTVGSKSVTVEATGYSVASVTQQIDAGTATKLGIKTQPTAPASNGAVLATQPAVYIQDQYGNTTTSTATVVAAVGSGAWTLGGTTSVAAVAGTTTYSDLTATSAAAVTGATIGFTSSGLTGINSSTFDIPAPPLDAPVAIAATNISTTGFTANWNAAAGATSYRLDVSEFSDFIDPAATEITETFTDIGGGTTSSYLTRTWTGNGDIQWTAYKSRTDQVVFTGNEAITLQNENGAYLISEEITGGLSELSFDVMQVFSGSGGELVIDILTGVDFSMVTNIGTYSYTTAQSSFENTSIIGITSSYKIRITNNTSARPAIDNLLFKSLGNNFLDSYENLTVAGTSQTVSNLTPNTTYYYRVRATDGVETSANSNTISASTDASTASTYTGTGIWSEVGNWSAGLPGASTNVTVNGTLTVDDVVECDDLTISTSGAVTVTTGQGLFINGDFLIQSSAAGTGSFIGATADYDITGSTTVQRYLSKYDAAGDSKYHFISTPVDAQPIFTDLTDLYRYSEIENYWINRTSTGDPEAFGDANFVVGRGYLVANVADVTKVFTGTLNSFLTGTPLVLTGTNTPDKGDGWNLFGNPFPSAIDWDGVVKGDGMDNALYYYDASIENYKYYINIDGVTVGSGSRYIPAMQGFMVHAKSSGTKTISIDNDDRVHQAQTVFYKAATATPVSLSLKVSAGDYEDVAFVHFNEGATTQFDGAYDAYKLSSYNTLVPMIYTQSSNNEDLAINGLPELTEELAIPVYFVPGTEGIQTLTANLEGLMSTVVYLKDNKTNTTQNLTQNPIYSFTATEGDNPDRFLLHFGIVGIEDNTSNLSQINAYAYQNQLYVQSNLNEARVSLFDIQGHQLLSREIDGAGSTRIPLDLPTGIYIVRLQSNNQVKNVKVFIN